MKIRSELKAGRDVESCGQELSWWQYQAGLMEQYVNNPSNVPPKGLWFPPGGAVQLPEYPGGRPVQLPEFPNVGNRDMSGFCG
jgi:hypothetical protein